MDREMILIHPEKGSQSHVYEVRGGQWRLLHTVSAFDGLGNYYGYVTNLCGFKTGKHEGKVTGLAAYGEDRHREVLESFIRYAEGSMTNVGNAFRGGALEKLRKALPADFRREDLAASIQNLSEDIATRFVGYHHIDRMIHSIYISIVNRNFDYVIQLSIT